MHGFMHSCPDAVCHCFEDQRYFWTSEWQEGERQADADIAAGRTQLFETVEDLIAWLDVEPA